MNHNILDLALDIRAALKTKPCYMARGAADTASAMRVTRLQFDSIDAYSVVIYQDNLPKRALTVSYDRFGHPKRVIDRAVLKDWEARGGTLIVQEISDRVPAAQGIVVELTKRMEGRVWANLFFTHCHDGIDAHWDDNNVIIVQAKGQRNGNFGHRTPCTRLRRANNLPKHLVYLHYMNSCSSWAIY